MKDVFSAVCIALKVYAVAFSTNSKLLALKLSAFLCSLCGVQEISLRMRRKIKMLLWGLP